MVPNPRRPGTVSGGGRAACCSGKIGPIFEIDLRLSLPPREEEQFLSSGILLVDCPDRRGIVASIAQFLYERGANILHSDQHQDNETGRFFMRIEWALEGFDLPEQSFVERFT